MRAVILVENEIQDQELWGPIYCLKFAGWEVVIAGPGIEIYKGKYGIPVKSEIPFQLLKTDDYDVVIIPGGWGAERLRLNNYVISFVREMYAIGKITAAICHGPWVTCSAGILRGKNATCYKGIRDDVVAAGGIYVDATVVVDGNLITSPHYNDIPHFIKAIVNLEENMRKTNLVPGVFH